MAPVCSQFVGRSEHNCGPKAQQSVDSSGIRTHNLHNTCALKGRRSYQLSHLLLRVECRLHIFFCCVINVCCYFRIS